MINKETFVNKLPNDILPMEMKSLFKFIESLDGFSEDTKLWFRFERGSGIGVGVYVKCGDVEKDITDYATW